MKTLIYPFDIQAETIIQFYEMLIDIEIVSCISFKSFGMIDKKYQIGNKIVNVSDDFNKELEKCELVWVIDSDIQLDFQEYIVPKIKRAVCSEKKILVTRRLTIEEKKIIEKLVPVKDLIQVEENLEEEDLSDKRIYNIKTPIITICSLYNGLQQFYLELALKKELTKCGVKFLQVGSELIASVFGMETIPRYMFENENSEKDKIKRFNHFLKSKELEDNYDVIVLGIPGELMGLQENVFSELGVYAFEMLRTISSDCSILCLPCEENIMENKKKIVQIISNNFALPIDYFNIAPVKIDFEDSELKRSISYVRLGKEMLWDKMTENVFCVEIEGESKRLVEKVIRQLNSYGI